MGQPKKRRSPVTRAAMNRTILLILGVLTSANRPISVSTPLSVQDTSATSAATIITEVEVSHSRPGDQTIVRVEGNGRLTCQPLRLNNPERLVLDFSGAHLRSEEHTSELQSLRHLVCRLLLEKKKEKINKND